MQSIIRITGDRIAFFTGTRFGTATGSVTSGAAGTAPGGSPVSGISPEGTKTTGMTAGGRYQECRIAGYSVLAECTRMRSENGPGDVPSAA
jgi:hypothetical protein